jgi:hypothetical protein
MIEQISRFHFIDRINRTFLVFSFLDHLRTVRPSSGQEEWARSFSDRLMVFRTLAVP